MKSLKKFISEDFKLTKKGNMSQVKSRDLDEFVTDWKNLAGLSTTLFINSKRETCLKDIDKKHKDGVLPKALLRVKDKRMLSTRWLVSVLLGYEDYYDILRSEIIERELFNANQLDGYILVWHNKGQYYGSKKYNDNIDDYLNTYNVEI